MSPRRTSKILKRFVQIENHHNNDNFRSSSVESFRPASIHVFASNVTMHGFYHIFARHHSVIRRFAWSLAFLASLTLLILQSSNRVRYYLERPHVTKLDEISVLGLQSLDCWIIDEIDLKPFSQVEYWHFQLLQSAIWMSFVSMS